MTINEKTNKNLSSRLEELEESCQKLKQFLNINSYDFQNSEKFKDFLRARNKKNELDVSLFQKKNKLIFQFNTIFGPYLYDSFYERI